MGEVASLLPQKTQENGKDIRMFLPKFGTINERRHRLHEVVRLSGMNINVDEDDYPLIIKVASLPGTRMQVYFLDNEEYFKRKSVFEDAEGAYFEDNLDRTLFFCKGVIETVKKFGWAPDIVHLHGWMTSLLPALFKSTYKNEPIFRDSQVVYSAYNADAPNVAFKDTFRDKMIANGLGDTVEAFFTENGLDLNAGASKFAEGTVAGTADLVLDNLTSPVLDYEEEYSSRYFDFFEELLAIVEE
jgi:starch synthase